MLSSKTIIAIAAMDKQRTIGKNGNLPLRKAPEDMAFFRKEITGKTVIMGRKTYESFRYIYAKKYPDIHGHPLASKNIIMTRQDIPGATTARSLEEITTLCDDDTLYIIG
jgi:dihydrofolate reductase